MSFKIQSSYTFCSTHLLKAASAEDQAILPLVNNWMDVHVAALNIFFQQEYNSKRLIGLPILYYGPLEEGIPCSGSLWISVMHQP